MDKNLKANIIVGGRFHGNQLFYALQNAGFDVLIYTSSPKNYWKGIDNNKIIFVPKLDQIISKIFKVKLPRIFSTVSTLIFDYIISKLMRDADLIWGFNGESLLSAKKQKKLNPLSKYIVDRACPHFLTQQDLMIKESREIKYYYRKHSEFIKKRFCDEYLLADKIVVPSNFTLNSFIKRGFNKNQLSKAPLDGNLYINDKNINKVFNKNSRFKSKDKKIKLGFIGGSFLRKGIIYLLRSLKYLSQDNLKLYIRANKNQIFVHREAKELCEKYNVEFISYIKNMSDFYNNIDIFILTSIEEGFGMVLFEAMKFGLPIVATSNVGAIDNLEKNIEYIEIPPKEPKALAMQINKLIDNPDLRYELSNNVYKKYEQLKIKGSLYEKSIKEILHEMF